MECSCRWLSPLSFGRSCSCVSCCLKLSIQPNHHFCLALKSAMLHHGLKTLLHCGAKCMHLIYILMLCAGFRCKNASVPLLPYYLFDVSFVHVSYWWFRPCVPAVLILLLSDRIQISWLAILAESLVFYHFPQASTSRRPTQKTQKLYSARYTHPSTLWLSHSAMCEYNVRTFSTLTDSDLYLCNSQDFT